MKFATLTVSNPAHYAQARDGAFVVVSKDESAGALVPQSVAASLLGALEQWKEVFPKLQEIGAALESGSWKETVKLQSAIFKAPLPRTYQWLDGSAFIQHIILARKARGVEPPKSLETDPLMYQGISDYLDGPNEPILDFDPAYGIDLEGEVGVFLDETPLGIRPEEARHHIKLLSLINDVSFRGLIPAELEKGFGFVHGKPSTSYAPFAVTPDELGASWKDGRIYLEIECRVNGKLIGTPSASEMHFSFDELIAHAAKTRRLSAGTFIGSGTISNRDPSKGVACLVEKRMLEILKAQASNPDKPELHIAATPFLQSGDLVEIDMKRNGRSVFGKISQRVMKPGS